MAEFLLLRTDHRKKQVIWIIEAKSSSPNPYNLDSREKFPAYIDEIREKLLNAFSLTLAACLHRHDDVDTEFPEFYKNIDLSSIDFKFILVVNNHKAEWLPPLNDALKKALHATVKSWGLGGNSVTVINNRIACDFGLITE